MTYFNQVLLLVYSALWRLQKLYDAFNDQSTRADHKKRELLIVAVRIQDVNNCQDVLRKLDRNYNMKTKKIVVDLHDISLFNRFLSQVCP